MAASGRVGRDCMRGTMLSCGVLSSLIMLAVTTPGMKYFQTYFDNLNDLSIQGARGVIRIDWGIWRVCYFPANLNGSSICTPTHWVDHPYAITLTENGNQVSDTSNKSWPCVLFIQFFVSLQSFFVLIVAPFLFNWVDEAIDRAITANNTRKTERVYIGDEVNHWFQAAFTGQLPLTIVQTTFQTAKEAAVKPNEKKDFRLKVIMCFALYVWVSNFTAFLAEIILYWAIQTELQKLETGGPTKVINYEKEGFVLATLGNWIFIVIFFIIFCCSAWEIKKTNDDTIFIEKEVKYEMERHKVAKGHHDKYGINSNHTDRGKAVSTIKEPKRDWKQPFEYVAVYLCRRLWSIWEQPS